MNIPNIESPDILLSLQNFIAEMDKSAIIINIVEICILAFALYYSYARFIKGTQSENLVRGSLFLVVMWACSELLIRINLNILGVFTKTLVSIVSFALIVIFQPELRRFLGYIGQGNLFEKLFMNSSDFVSTKKIDVIKELIETIKYLSKSKTGGLIVLQKDVASLTQSDVGVQLNADISQELLLTIFFPKTPLHRLLRHPGHPALWGPAPHGLRPGRHHGLLHHPVSFLPLRHGHLCRRLHHLRSG